MRQLTALRGTVTVALALLAALPAIFAGAEGSRRDTVGVDLLRRAQAAAAARAFSYEFEYLGLGMAAGRLTGLVHLRQVTDMTDSFLRVEGEFVTLLAGLQAPGRFTFSTDGTTVWLRDDETGEVQSERRGEKASALALPGLYGIVQELVDSRPFWLDLDPATGVEYLGRAEVSGVACDLVRTTRPERQGMAPTETLWWLARDDGLPRQQVRLTDVQGHHNWYQMTVRDLEVGRAEERSFFRLGAGDADRGAVAPARPHAPGFRLRTPRGRVVDLDDLRGRVVVLDFWNTWCVLCKSHLPGVSDLARELAGRPVTFLAVNLWETGDPVTFWRENGFAPTLLLDGDDVATSYGVRYTPAVVVIGPDGTIVHAQHGTSGTRNEELEAAIREALERAAPPQGSD